MLLSNKFARPSYAAGLVDRPPQYRQLDRWREVRAVLVQAQAGFGKSSFVSRWLDVSGMAARAAWLTIDDGDADTLLFVRDVATALDTLRPGALALVQPILEDTHGSADRALTKLLAEFEALPGGSDADRHLLLVLDDLHRALTPEIGALVVKLLESGPPLLHLILVMRERTDLPLARLYGHGKVAIVTTDDLRFTEAQIAEYLGLQGFPRPSAEQLAAIVKDSDGWPMGLQLAVLSLRDPGSLHELMGALRGDRDWLAEFLSDEVLNRQPEEVRRFLLFTSVLDQLDPALCQAVTGDAMSAAHLAALTDARVFIVRLGDEGGRFRYHHLFQQFLQHRLNAVASPRQRSELHRRAGMWFAEAGRVEDAVRHLLAAGDEDHASQLVAIEVRRTMLRSPHAAKRLLDMLPANVVERRPRLLFDLCHIEAMFDGWQLPAMLRRALTSLAEHSVPASEAEAFHVEGLVLGALSAHLNRDFAAANQLADEASRSTAPMTDFVRATLEFLQMHLKHYRGLHSEGQRHADLALSAMRTSGFTQGEVALRREMARWSMRRGDSEEAARLFAELIRFLKFRHVTATHDTTLAYIYAAENSFWQNRLEAARRHQQAAHASAKQLEDQALIYATSYLKHFLGATSIDSAELAKKTPILPDLSIPRGLAETLMLMSTHWYVAAGHGELARSALRVAGVNRAAQTVEPIRAPLLSWLYASIATGENLHEAESILTVALGRAEATENRFFLLHLLTLHGWLQHKLHGESVAANTIQQALQLARETGYTRVPYGIPELMPVLREFRGAAKFAKTRSAGVTKAEAEVLRLLAEDFSYEDIAAQLISSVNTIRTHVRSLYRKLSVHRREQAIEVGRKVGLLPPAPISG